MVSEKGQLLNNGQNSCSHSALYSEVRLYIISDLSSLHYFGSGLFPGSIYDICKCLRTRNF